MARTLGLVLAALLVASSAGAQSIHATRTGARARAGAFVQPQPGDYSVLLVVLDDLGTDQLALYALDAGPPMTCTAAMLSSLSTPRLDELASTGVMFTRCYVDPTCSATRAATLTGRHGLRTGVGMMINPGDTPPYRLPVSEVTLPVLLRGLGLPTSGTRCAAFGKWHLAGSTGDDCHPTDSGFEEFRGLMGNPASHYAWRKVVAPAPSGGACSASEDVPAVPGTPPTETTWTAGVTRADATAWINGLSAAERFFAYVALSPPHAPWEVPPFRTLSARTRARLSFQGYEAGDVARPGQPDDERMIYRANVEALDFEVGRLLDDIDPAALARTLVIVVGDNGTPGTMLAPVGMEGHGKRTLFEQGTRVPLIVSGPLAVPGGVCRELVSVVDLWRTVANTLGLDDATIDGALGATALDSRSFLASIQDPARAGARSDVYFEILRNGLPLDARNWQRGATDGRWRYVRIHASDGVSYAEHLYHTETDPCESTDLVPPAAGSAAETALVALRAVVDGL